MAPRESPPLLMDADEMYERQMQHMRSRSEPAYRSRKSPELEELTSILASSEDDEDNSTTSTSSSSSSTAEGEEDDDEDGPVHHDNDDSNLTGSVSDSSSDDECVVLTRRSKFPINEPRNRRRRSSTTLPTSTNSTPTKPAPPPPAAVGATAATTTTTSSEKKNGGSSSRGLLARRASIRGRSSTRKKDNLDSSKSSFDHTLDSSKNTLDNATLGDEGTVKSSKSKDKSNARSKSTNRQHHRSSKSPNKGERREGKQRSCSSPHATPSRKDRRSPSSTKKRTEKSPKRTMQNKPEGMRRSQSVPETVDMDQELEEARLAKQQQQRAAREKAARGRSSTKRTKANMEGSSSSNLMRSMNASTNSTSARLNASSSSAARMNASINSRGGAMLMDASSSRLDGSASRIRRGSVADARQQQRRQVRSESQSKSRSTALNIFDRSNSSAESFQNSFCEDETRKLVKEAGFLEASEYIGGPRLSTMQTSKSAGSALNESSGYLRSASQKPRRPSIADKIRRGSNRSASLNPDRLPSITSGSEGESFYSGSASLEARDVVEKNNASSKSSLNHSSKSSLNYSSQSSFNTSKSSLNNSKSSLNSSKRLSASEKNNARPVSLNPKREKKSSDTRRSASVNPSKETNNEGDFSIIRAASSPETIPVDPQPKRESHGEKHRSASRNHKQEKPGDKHHRSASHTPKKESHGEKSSNPRSSSSKPRSQAKRISASEKDTAPRSASLNPKRVSVVKKIDGHRSKSVVPKSNSQAKPTGSTKRESTSSDQAANTRPSSSQAIKKESAHSTNSGSARSASLKPRKESMVEKVNQNRSKSVNPKSSLVRGESYTERTEDSTVSTAPRRSSGKKRKSKIYFPPNPPRQVNNNHRRHSLTCLEKEGGKGEPKDVDEISVGTRQSILDSIASPSSSRPTLSKSVFQEPANNREKAHNQLVNPNQQQNKAATNTASEVKSPTALPSLLAPPSDESGSDEDSKQGLLDNISISDIMSSTSKREDLFKRITMDDSLALTDRWEPIPVSLPFQDGALTDISPSSHYEDRQDATDATGSELGLSSRDDSPRPDKRERKGRRERKPREEGEKQRRLSPKRESQDDKRQRGRKKLDPLQKATHHAAARRAASNSLSRSKRLSASENDATGRARSNSRSVSRSSARMRITNALANHKAEGEALYRRQSLMDAKNAAFAAAAAEALTADGGEEASPVSAPAQAAEYTPGLSTAEAIAKLSSSLNIVSLYGELEGAPVDPKSASLSSMRKSAPDLSEHTEGDMDDGRNKGMAHSEPGMRLRNSSMSRDRSRSKDRESLKMLSRNRMAKERSRRSFAVPGGENDYGKSDNDFSKSISSNFTNSNSDFGNSGTDMSLDRSQSHLRGSRNKNPQQRLRGRRTTVGHHMLHNSINSIPDLEPMQKSGHSSGPIRTLTPVKEQVWQKRRRQSVTVGDSV